MPVVDARKATALEQLAHGLDHKLRNHLNGVRAHLALLQKAVECSQAAPRAIQLLERLDEAIDGMETTLAGMVEFMCPGQEPWAEVGIEALLIAALPPQAELARQQVQVERDFAGDLPLVLVDRTRLQRQFAALIGNALDAMPDGGRLTLRVRRAGKGRVEIEIADTGCGINEGDGQRIFEPFFSTRPGHVGLGLAGARRAIRSLFGRIRFTSQPGKGSSFLVTLPTARRCRLILARRARRREWLHVNQQTH